MEIVKGIVVILGFSYLILYGIYGIISSRRMSKEIQKLKNKTKS